MSHHCLEIKQEPPNWYGDLEDDCCAKWMELLLRAEWEDGEGTDEWWWWAVSNMETGETLDASYKHSHVPNSADDARQCAEDAARRYFASIYSALFRHVN